MNDSPDRRRVFLRVLVRALALFLVPVVVVAAPSVASAATLYGDDVGFSVSLSDLATDSFDCNGTAQWVVPDTSGLITPYVKFANIKCGDTALLGNQFGCDADDCATLNLRVEGEGCTGSDTASVVSDTTGWHTFAGPSIALDPLCNVSALCMSFDGYANNYPDMGAGEECIGWALGVAPEPGATSGGCTYGAPVSVHVQSRYSWPNTIYQAKVTFTGLQPGTTFRAQGLVPFSGATGAAGTGYNKFFQLDVNTTNNGQWVDVGSISDSTQKYTYPSPLNQGSVIGTQIYLYSPNDPAMGYYNSNLAIRDSQFFAANNVSATGWRGATSAPDCAFYLGQDIRSANVPNDPMSVPYGVMEADNGEPDQGTPVGDDDASAPGPSDTMDESCTEGFSLWNPASWLSAGYCEIVSGLSTVAKGVLDIPSKILGGLRSLFVPAHAPSWSDVPSPLKSGWVPNFDSLPHGACGPLTMPRLELGFKSWSVGPVDMLDTCDAPWPLVRTFTFNGLLAMVLIGVIWKAFHAAAAALGMNVSNDSGGSDE